MMSIEGHCDLAAIFILIAMVADALDGRVARALHTAGPMGVELDSLSDDISFGIAAGALIYSYQLHELGWVGIIPCALLGTFCAFRLARFNVKVTSVHGYFEGLPCPTTGVIISAYVLSGAKVWNWLIVLWVLLLAFLMVSEIHYPDNKGASADQLHVPAVLIALLLRHRDHLLLAGLGGCHLRCLHPLWHDEYLPQPRKGKRKAIRRKQKRAPEDIEQ